MTESTSEIRSGSSPINHNNLNDNNGSSRGVPEIPIEIVSDKEMAILEAALAMASAGSSLSSSSHSLFHRNVRSVHSITALSKRGFPASPDMEDFGATRKKTHFPDSFLLRFRKKKSLSVTDFTSTVISFSGFFCSSVLFFLFFLNNFYG